MMFSMFVGEADAIQRPPIRVGSKKTTSYTVRFLDPDGSSDIGGAAFDRQRTEIGVNVQSVRNSAVSVSPVSIAAAVSYVTSNPAIAAVRKLSTTLIEVQGLSRGAAVLKAKNLTGRDLVGSVFSPKTGPRVAVHIINSPDSTTNLSIASAQTLLDKAQYIWRQANVSFEIVEVNIVFVSTPLGIDVDLQSYATDDYTAITDAAKNLDAELNLYYVHSLTIAGAQKAGATYDPPTSDVFVAFNQSLGTYSGRVTAHEFGHALGLTSLNNVQVDYPTSDTARKYELMWADADGGTTVIPMHGRIVNPVLE